MRERRALVTVETIDTLPDELESAHRELQVTLRNPGYSRQGYT